MLQHSDECLCMWNMQTEIFNDVGDFSRNAALCLLVASFAPSDYHKAKCTLSSGHPFCGGNLGIASVTAR